MDHKIEYSNEEMVYALEKSLGELNVFRYDGEYRAVLGQSFVDKLAKWEQDIHKCKESPFTIVVTGDFKRGKSTLINALLGEEIVPTDVTTETVTLNRISYGLPSNEAVLSQNRRVRLSDDELKRERLEKIIEELGEPIQRVEMKRPCEMLKRVTIIDTPGTGDAMKDFSAVVRDSLIQADAVIYVYNVQYPLSKSEQMFIKAAILPQKYTKLFMVGNYSDILQTQDEYDRMEKMLKNRVEDLLPREEFYMVSALDELCRKLGEETRENQLTPLLRQRFDQLRIQLDKLVEERAETVVVDRMMRLTASMAEDLNSELTAMENGLDMEAKDAALALSEAEKNKQESVETHAQLMKNIDEIIQKMKVETNAWMSDFMERIVQESKALEGVSNDDLKRYYEFYCVDLMQEAMNTCVEYHQDHLYDLMDDIVKGMGEKAVSAFGGNRTYHFRINLDNRVWTRGDTVGLVTSYVSQTSYLAYTASLIADGISGAMREKEKQDRTSELVKQISRKLLSMSAMISETVDTVYDELRNKAKELIVEYYEDEIKKVQHLLEQTIQVAGKDAAEKERVASVIKKAREALGKVQTFI